LGGTFLINLGPNENAEIIEEELEALDFYYRVLADINVINYKKMNII